MSIVPVVRYPAIQITQSSLNMTAHRLKFVTVGDGAVGKTALLTRYAKGTYFCEYIPSVFESWVEQKVVDGTDVEIVPFDTVGCEDYDRLRPRAYPQTDVFLLCFALDAPSSFTNIKERWYPELNHHCPGVPIILVGTKEDLRDDSQVISSLATRDLSPITYPQGLKCARDIGAVRYMECSALTEKGVQEVFIEGVRAALRVKKPTQHHVHVPSRKCSFL